MMTFVSAFLIGYCLNSLFTSCFCANIGRMPNYQAVSIIFTRLQNNIVKNDDKCAFVNIQSQDDFDPAKFEG